MELHEVSFFPNGSISAYRRVLVPLDLGFNVSLVQASPAAADSQFVYLRVAVPTEKQEMDWMPIIISRQDGRIAKVPLPPVLAEYSPVEEWYAGPAPGSLYVFLASVDVGTTQAVTNASVLLWKVGSDPVLIGTLSCPPSSSIFAYVRWMFVFTCFVMLVVVLRIKGLWTGLPIFTIAF